MSWTETFRCWNTHTTAIGLMITLHVLGALLDGSMPWYVLASETLQGCLFAERNRRLGATRNPHLFMVIAALLQPYRFHVGGLVLYILAHGTAVLLYTWYLFMPAYRHLDSAMQTAMRQWRDSRK